MDGDTIGHVLRHAPPVGNTYRLKNVQAYRAETFTKRSLPLSSSDGSIKIIRLIDYPLGGKQAYLDWVTSSSRTLIEQPELKVVAAYDNYYGTSPHRLITIEFESQVEMAAWKALEIRKTFDAELDERAGSWKEHTFELRADYINE